MFRFAVKRWDSSLSRQITTNVCACGCLFDDHKKGNNTVEQRLTRGICRGQQHRLTKQLSYKARRVAERECRIIFNQGLLQRNWGISFVAFEKEWKAKQVKSIKYKLNRRNAEGDEGILGSCGCIQLNLLYLFSEAKLKYGT